MERLMLLDGNGLIYRGYFALINVPLSTSKGELVNAVFGFSNIVLRGFQDVRPDYVAIAFDLPAPTFRHELSAAYKATRRPMPDDLRAQFPKVREVVAALRLPVYELAGFEADDVIGTLTREAESRDLETTIVTGDLDMLQLVTDRTRLMTTRMGVDATVMYDLARIHERYGLAADQMIDFKALKGDSTDNIPGVPGVGDKTAAKLIIQFGDLDALFSRLDEVTPEKLREKLREHHDGVLASRELVTIHRDLPVALDLDAARFGDYDRDEVVRLFREYEFRTLIDRFRRSAARPPLERKQLGKPTAIRRANVGRENEVQATARTQGDRQTSRLSCDRHSAPAQCPGLRRDPGPEAATACSSRSTSTRSARSARPRQKPAGSSARCRLAISGRRSPCSSPSPTGWRP